jgi:hypothetical protein
MLTNIDISEKKKYNYAVYCQMKDEDLLINTWIEHYISLGFEHLYIVDDNSTNKISDLLIDNPYMNNITLFTLDFTTEDFINGNIKHSFFYNENIKVINVNKQTYILNLICKIISKDIEWLFICDADEFLYLKDYDTIQKYMDYTLTKQPNISAINFQWLFYGTSYYSYFPEKGHLFDNFIYSDDMLNNHGKSMIKTSDCIYFDVHACELIENKIYGMPFTNNDYYIITKEERNNYYTLLDNKNIIQPYTNVNAFCAHFFALDCNSFFKRRFICKRLDNNLVREKNFAENIKFYNNMYNTSLVKNNNNHANVECDKLLNIQKYNLTYNTNLHHIFDVLQHFYENKTELVFNTIDDILPNDFDVAIYKELNPDLNHFTDIQAKFHYLNNGINENRNYKIKNIMLPNDFDATIYKKLNPDLNHFTDIKATFHYLNTGIYENRNYKITLSNDFDVTIHNKLNPEIQKYPYLFHKYILNIENPNKEIDYVIFKKNNHENEFVCNLHIYDIHMFDSFYDKYISNLLSEFNITITYVIGDIPKHILNYNVNIIKIKNKGYDIGGKICFLKFLFDENIQYKYILFLHSKTNIEKRNSYFEPLIKNLNRIKLTKNLLKYKNIYSIFPNIIWYDYPNDKNFNEYDLYVSNINYYNELTDFLKLSNTDKIFPEGNCFICNRIIMDFLFNNNYMLFYNMLNYENSFDVNWFQIFYSYSYTTIHKSYELYNRHNMHGNNILLSSQKLSLPDGMIEHVFERLWINIIKHLNGDYLIMNDKNIIDTYNIKLNAIYFPQFHETPENNDFWGNKFTEWSLLKPYDDNIVISKTNYHILKPHDDIGYYNLDDNGITINKQIEIAKKYNIHGFIIYHYWFDDNKKVLYKPLEYFLNDNIDYPFCISWANEAWSRRWDGTNHEILIEQKYIDNENSYLIHINYLIQFFKKHNYMKNNKGQCILYIYNFNDLIHIYENMINVWNIELEKHNLDIDIIITENNNKQNHSIDNFNLTKFIFEPMYSTVYNNLNTTNLKKLIHDNVINTQNFDIEYYLENNKDLKAIDKSELYNHFINYGFNESRKIKLLHNNNNNHLINHNMCINYDDIINSYKSNKYDTTNKHLGLPLYWNNVVRRTDLPFLFVKNYSDSKMEELLMLLITDIVYKYKNNYYLNNSIICKNDNIININAWNEWNEQAILEPNNITGFSVLESIYKIISKL